MRGHFLGTIWLTAVIMAAGAHGRPPAHATLQPGRAAPASASRLRPGEAPASNRVTAIRPGEAPAGNRVTAIRPGGETVIPSGRLLTPHGRQFTVAPHPFGLALSPDGRTLAAANSGTGPFCVSILKDPAGSNPLASQYPPGQQGDADVLRSVFMGLAFGADNRTLYVAGGDDGTVHVLDSSTGAKIAAISCNAGGFEESYIGDLAMSPNRRTLYAVDQANFRLVIIDTVARAVAGSIRVGRYPFAVAVSPDGRRAWVANIGMYEYQPIEGGTLPYPPFAVPSREAEEGVTIDGKKAPGLGKPNAPESVSVWSVDVSDPARLKVVTRTKTGTPVGELTEGQFPAVGGSAPNALAVTATRVYVSNTNNDNVQVLDAASGRILATVPLALDRSVKARGAMPFGLTLSPDGRRLYVAEAGLNAVAVVDTARNRVLGHIPVGWYPSKVQVAPDGRTLYVSNAKGFGAGPNGGPAFKPGPAGSYVAALMRGTISVMKTPADAELPALTRRVMANNGFPLNRPTPSLAALRKAIRTVIFITKENRTFDEVFGDMPGVNGEPTLARYGKNATVSGEGQPTITGVNVMPNHRALAERYGINDNFYADGDVSADGHRWLEGVPPNEYTEAQVAAAYGGRSTFSTKTPGRRAFFGSNASPMPEDYPEAGSIFDHVARFGVPFRNYGEGFEFAGVSEGPDLYPTGAAESINIPMSKPLFENTSREFPIFNMNISDQYRASQFIKDLRLWESGKAPMPRFINIALPNDHTAGARPADGYPYATSFVADNDLALGRIVEALSHSRFWKGTAIFVTEDDAQSGVDHVDGHRTIMMAMGPYVRHGAVSHRHGSIPSIIHTINLLLGLPPLNQYDATASDLLDLFTTTPDTAPYTAIAPDPRLFDPAKVHDISRSTEPGPRRDDPEYMRRQQSSR